MKTASKQATLAERDADAAANVSRDAGPVSGSRVEDSLFRSRADDYESRNGAGRTGDAEDAGKDETEDVIRRMKRSGAATDPLVSGQSQETPPVEFRPLSPFQSS